MNENPTYSAFAGQAMVVSGPLSQLIPALKSASEQAEDGPVLVFEDRTGRQVDFDLRGSPEEALARALPPPRTGPGRPRLGVVGREISLMPRHWEWLEEQPNGASAALRRLVDQARSQDQTANRVRLAVEAAGRFMSAMAGNFAGYEEATRALYARDRSRLEALTAEWPRDVRRHMLQLLSDCI